MSAMATWWDYGVDPVGFQTPVGFKGKDKKLLSSAVY